MDNFPYRYNELFAYYVTQMIKKISSPHGHIAAIYYDCPQLRVSWFIC